ncbi:MAG: TIGR03960 family B12-binding radical SAM protein, partial [Chloroflexi bacterium]|nr:TIGR03960 family B12-binding radical SAM protein [Chloroflexota bacterium]
LGMSNHGLAILYDILNRRSDMLAERVFCPWLDMEAVMRREGIPLYSLETKHPIREFDILGISLPYEQLYSNTLNLLDLAGIPLLAIDRDETHPLVIAGGHATYNPDPMADFIDAFAIGEGEDIIVDIVRCVQEWKSEVRGRKSEGSRAELLKRLALIEGCYVPSLYDVSYHADGTVAGFKSLAPEARLPVTKRIVPILPPPLTKFIVPFADVTHNRAVVEIMRGCTRGCRFCHAGMVTRPVRERTVDEIVQAIEEIVRDTGFENVALLSLSSSDYDDVLPLVKAVSERFRGKHLNLSMPSMRIESLSVDLMDALIENKRGGFTLAPEAATERMREIINKAVPTPMVLDTAREIYSRGWTTIKLYFMIGHPSETLEDVQAIAALCKAVLAEGRKALGKKANVHAGVSTFVPKPHTPFQWSPADTREQILAKQSLLKRAVRGPGLKLNWNNPDDTLLEAFLSRGDRRLGAVIYEAWKHGAKFDAWQDQHRHGAWLEAFRVVGLDPYFYTHRERPIDETFPWEIVDVAVKKKFLAEDWFWSQRGQTRVDCRERCFACGILPKFTEVRMETPAEAWECPPVKPKHLRGKQAAVIPLAEIA